MHFVFLQGMPSFFFSRIGAKLEAQGHRVTRVNLCWGDALFWRGTTSLDYRGSLGGWPAFISDFYAKNNVTDLVLLGEQRKYHKEAVAIARQRGIRVTVTDFGYLRPDWITFERDGMSSLSRFPRKPDSIRKLAAQADPPDLSPKYVDDFWTMARCDLLHSFSSLLGLFLYPFYRQSDERPHPLIYFPAVGWRLLFRKMKRCRAKERLAAMVKAPTRFFVFPLQLTHDFQIVAYSPFKDLGEAILTVLDSFTTHAPPDTRLLIKLHPWDPGLKNWKNFIFRTAEPLGIHDRIDYFDGGDLDEMCRHAAGMVTINSTSGVRALQLGCPVVTLGDAVYDIDGLTFRHGLDRYWSEATRPDPAFVDAFIRALAATIQIRGVFFSEPGLSTAIAEAVQRLSQQKVGEVREVSATLGRDKNKC